MIIEFLGVSGVGKTTVAEKYRQDLEDHGNKVVWDTRDLYRKHNWLSRNLRKMVFVFSYGIRNRKWCRSFRKYLAMEIENWKDEFRPYFNGIFLKYRLAKDRSGESVRVFDEGAIQFLWAIKLRSGKAVTEEDVTQLFRFFEVPDELIVVEAETQKIIQRLEKRGEYVRIMDNGDLADSIEKMRAVQEAIIGFLPSGIQVKRIRND